MGKQTNIRLRATVDNTIYYQWRGIDCIRTVPAKVRQTANTKKAATVFGMAVKNAARLRGLVKPVLADPGNRNMIYELDNAFRRWLHTAPFEKDAIENGLPFFESFSFNKKATTGKIFRAVKITREEDRSLRIMIPAFNPVKNITAPKGTVSIGIKLVAASLPFDNLDEAKALQTSIRFAYENKLLPPEEIELPAVTQLKTLVVITMALQFYRSADETVPIEQMRWKPTAIIGSFYN